MRSTRRKKNEMKRKRRKIMWSKGIRKNRKRYKWDHDEEKKRNNIIKKKKMKEKKKKKRREWTITSRRRKGSERMR